MKLFQFFPHPRRLVTKRLGFLVQLGELLGVVAELFARGAELFAGAANLGGVVTKILGYHALGVREARLLLCRAKVVGDARLFAGIVGRGWLVGVGASLCGRLASFGGNLARLPLGFTEVGATERFRTVGHRCCAPRQNGVGRSLKGERCKGLASGAKTYPV